ncbi:MAG: efflux transporter outer membrane subunit [Chitinophagales bacterium]|nr:efflux transporter outer membrane subunit [Bacteroidota bacterium]MCB9043232.1 efflux transporter outer membrane subunit [Chitinophagales bacterium]
MKTKYYAFFFALSLLFLPACKVLTPYHTPSEKLTKALKYRLDVAPADSTSLADFSWKEIFADTLLQAYISKALSENIDVRIALKNMEIAEAYLQQANVNIAPTVALNPTITYSTSSLNTQFGQLIGERRHLFQYGVGLQMNWEIDIWGKLLSERKAVAADYMRSVAGQQAVASQVVASLATAYFQLMAYDEQRDILLQNIDYRAQYITTSKALKEAGLLTEVAVKQAEAQLLNVKSRLLTTDYLIKTQENYLHLLMGESPDTLLRSKLSQTEISANIQTAYPIQLLANRPDVRAAEFELIKAFELTNVAQAQFYPSLTITGSTGLQSIDLDKLFSLHSIFANIVGGLTQPIFNQKRIRSNLAVRKSSEEIAYLNFRKSLLTATQEVSNALAAFETQSNIAALKQREYETFALATQFSEDLVNNGLGNYLDIILANERALNAQLEYIQARYAQLSAQVQLYRALGGGWR